MCFPVETLQWTVTVDGFDALWSVRWKGQRDLAVQYLQLNWIFKSFEERGSVYVSVAFSSSSLLLLCFFLLLQISLFFFFFAFSLYNFATSLSIFSSVSSCAAFGSTRLSISLHSQQSITSCAIRARVRIRAAFRSYRSFVSFYSRNPRSFSAEFGNRCESVRIFFCLASRAMGEGEGGDIAPKNALSSEVVPPAVTSTAALEVPAKKLARQLDFTGAPEHPQQQPVAVLPLPPQAPHSRIGWVCWNYFFFKWFAVCFLFWILMSGVKFVSCAS